MEIKYEELRIPICKKLGIFHAWLFCSVSLDSLVWNYFSFRKGVEEIFLKPETCEPSPFFKKGDESANDPEAKHQGHLIK